MYVGVVGCSVVSLLVMTGGHLWLGFALVHVMIFSMVIAVEIDSRVGWGDVLPWNNSIVHRP